MFGLGRPSFGKLNQVFEKHILCFLGFTIQREVPGLSNKTTIVRGIRAAARVMMLKELLPLVVP